MEGGSHYRTEGTALGVEGQHDKKLPSKGPRFGDGRAAVDQEVVSPDLGDTETAYGRGGVRGHQAASSGDGELPSDEDSDDESHLGAEETFDEGSGSSNRKHPNKGPKVPTCPECGKTFPSDKSLFGHLRCHPERDYRGAIPPPGARKKSQSNASFSVTRGPPVTRWSTPKREQANDSGSPARCRRYQCSICFKTFASHQALGGHVANHNKNKSNVQEAPIAADNGSEHRCTICNLTFSSGQALGGHMRRHFNELQNQALSSSAHSSESDRGANHGMLQNRAPSSPANSSERDKGAIRGMFDFDLNEMPDL
ncbi:hypothetical protein MUK42_12586 [Musa troglodytarum]|uniref:C2H2-type domain-containing protein n=1 Tax=Musa troglodytarum TaxID=320322 RepID=A0A9E7GNR7_9LILI|nr:hypothetical protein MUK42_12586 [Musa troglodytarum]